MPETFIDLFSGAGGLSWGLRQAGLKPLLASDNWSNAVETYHYNMPDHPVLLKDVRELTTRDVLATGIDKPDWIVGGPPCQGYSTVGKRNRNDPRNVLFLEFKRIVKGINPKGFMIENVTGLKDMSFEQEVAESFHDLGYTVNVHVLTAANYGIPQQRRRIVFVGHKDKGRFQGPEATHSASNYASVDSAIGDLPKLEAGEENKEYTRSPYTNLQALLRGDSTQLQGHRVSRHPEHLVKAISFIPDGGNRKSIPEEYQPKGGFHNSYSRLASWLPAVAITQNLGKPSGTRSIHPTQNRGLTTREGARLQTFPDTFHFLGGITSQRLQVGNSVPPMLASSIGRALLDPTRWE